MKTPNRFLPASVMALSVAALGACIENPESKSYIQYRMVTGRCTLIGDQTLPYSMVTYENIVFWTQVLGADGTPYAGQSLAYSFDSQGKPLPQYASVAPQKLRSAEFGQLEQGLDVKSTLFKLALATDSHGMLTASRTAQKITLTQGSESGSSSSSSSADGLGAFFTLGIVGIGGVGVDSENASSYSGGFQVFSYQDTIPFWLAPEEFAGTITLPSSDGFRTIAPVQSSMEIHVSETYVRPVVFTAEEHEVLHWDDGQKDYDRGTHELTLDGQALENPKGFCERLTLKHTRIGDIYADKVHDDEHHFFDDADNEVTCEEFVLKAKDRVNCMSNHTALITETYVVE